MLDYTPFLFIEIYMLSDNKRLAKLPSKKGNTRWYTDAEKLEAVKLYMITGNQAAVAAALNLNKNTMNQWTNSQWFKDLSEQIKREGNIKLTNKLKGIAEKALDITIDRLDNGDFFYDQKTGEVRRKPIQAKDAHKIAVDFLDKSWEAESKIDKTAEESSTENKLNALAAAFIDMAKKTSRVEIIEHKEDANAVHDQREA